MMVVMTTPDICSPEGYPDMSQSGLHVLSETVFAI